MTEAMKTCSKCGETKPTGEYPRRSKSHDGRGYKCKPCANAYGAKWHAENREHRAAYDAQYRVENPHVNWEARYRIRARAFGFDPVVRSFTRDDLVSRYGDACVHCGGPFEELDHFPIPVGLGGVHAIENCRPTCTYDNRANSAAVRIARKAIAG